MHILTVERQSYDTSSIQAPLSLVKRDGGATVIYESLSLQLNITQKS